MDFVLMETDVNICTTIYFIYLIIKNMLKIFISPKTYIYQSMKIMEILSIDGRKLETS